MSWLCINLHAKYGYNVIAPRLVSELASEGARGGCLARLRSTRMQRDLDPCTVYHRHVHLNLIQIRIASCLFVRCRSNEKSCYEIVTIQKVIRFSIHLPQTRPFSARTFDPLTRVEVASLTRSETKRGATCPAGVF